MFITHAISLIQLLSAWEKSFNSHIRKKTLKLKFEKKCVFFFLICMYGTLISELSVSHTAIREEGGVHFKCLDFILV